MVRVKIVLPPGVADRFFESITAADGQTTVLIDPDLLSHRMLAELLAAGCTLTGEPLGDSPN